jgi:membrane peptidoglycan carboxypeptidase
MLNVGGVPRVAGGTFPARIWQAFMGPAHDGVPIEDFPPPPEPGPGTYLRLPSEGAAKHHHDTTTVSPLFPGAAKTDEHKGKGHR